RSTESAGSSGRYLALAALSSALLQQHLVTSLSARVQCSLPSRWTQQHFSTTLPVREHRIFSGVAVAPCFAFAQQLGGLLSSAAMAGTPSRAAQLRASRVWLGTRLSPRPPQRVRLRMTPISSASTSCSRAPLLAAPA